MYNNTFFGKNMSNMLWWLIPTNTVEKALQEKQQSLSIYYNVLSNVLMGLFEYDNMSYIHKKQLNSASFNACYIACISVDGTPCIVPCSPHGQLNTMGEYTKYNALLPDGSTKIISRDNAVIGYTLYQPLITDSLLVYNYAELISELKLSIKNAIIMSRKQAVIDVPDDNSVNEVLTSFNNHQIGTPVTVKRKRSDVNYNTLSFTEPTTVTDYYNNLRDIINEFLMVTGLSSLVNPNKKERMIVDEVSSTEDIKGTLLFNKIENRRDFIKNCNERYGTEWTVEINRNIDDVIRDVITTVTESEVNDYDNK